MQSHWETCIWKHTDPQECQIGCQNVCHIDSHKKCQIECQAVCQMKSQTECQIEYQKECQREFQNNQKQSQNTWQMECQKECPIESLYIYMPTRMPVDRGHSRKVILTIIVYQAGVYPFHSIRPSVRPSILSIHPYCPSIHPFRSSTYGCESKLCMERSAVFRTYGTKELRNWSCSGPLECDEI